MKKQLLALFILLFVLKQSRAQTNVYHAFPDTNVFWAYKHWNALNNPVHYDETRYGLNGDTSINGISYKKVYSLFDSTQSSKYDTYCAAIREQNKRVYTVMGNAAEQLLYDFNLQAGDTIKYSTSGSGSSFSRVLTKIDSMQLLDGTYRKRYSYAPAKQTFLSDTVVEGIGSIEWIGLFNPLVPGRLTNGDEYQVSCFKAADVALYVHNPSCAHCFCTFLTAVDNIENKSTLLIYPNPNTGCFTIETGLAEKQSLELFDINGRLVLSQSIQGTATIDATKLDNGIYNLLIKNSRSVSNKKLVMAR